MPEIFLNGEKKQVHAENIAALIQELEIPFKYILVEKNLQAVNRDDYDKTLIAEGDKIEIARPMSGG